MKKFSKALSVFLAVIMLFTAAPLSGFVGMEFPDIQLPGLNVFAGAEENENEDNTDDDVPVVLDTYTDWDLLFGNHDFYDVVTPPSCTEFEVCPVKAEINCRTS